jgi:LmbE family N-acetylglucosaminyl deacetylase
MSPYRHFVSEIARFAREGRQFPLGGFPPAPQPSIAPDSPKVLLLSPHPDDECVVGALALRLFRESGCKVVNVAITQGSKPARQAGRLAELQAACRFLGFDVVQTRPNGLERVNPKTRQQDPAAWQLMVQTLAGILAAQQPGVVFFPHDRDWNSTHLGTHHLAVDALRTLGPGFSTVTAETEFWGAMDDPNLAVESSVDDVADLVTATSFHVEEVRRNPYHLLLPAWMQDNVRRGGELVGGQGGAAPDFVFATLYRLRRWRDGQFERFYNGGRNLPIGENPARLLDAQHHFS